LRGQPYSLVIGHIDHRLRKSSAADARFVQRLAHRWDVPWVVTRVDVRAHAHKHHLGIEEAARELRYKALSRMARQGRCAAIVTAHTANDQAETVLMNFLRGAGPAGLAGIPAVRPLDSVYRLMLIRPLLSVTRDQIMPYLNIHSIPYRHDPSNRFLRFMRNRIRHEALPSLEKLYPGLAGRLVQGADIFRQEEDFWHEVVSRELRKTVRKNGQRITVVLPRLLRYHKALSRRILRHILPGLSFQDIEQVLILAQSPGRSGRLRFSGRRRVKREENQLVVA
jgi:tRNA(Ile)-lysidine synthase